MEATEFIKLTDLRLTAPIITVAVVSIIVLMLESFHRSQASRRYLAWVSVIGLGVAGLDTVYLFARDTDGFAMGQMLFIDGFSLVFNLVIIIGAILSCLVSPAYLASHRRDRGEYYALILMSVIGMMIMTSAADLFAMFIGLEMMSIPVYCLAGYFRHSARSAESGMKYFVLGAFASAVFLYGIALIYGVTGTTHLVTIANTMFSSMSGVDVTDAAAVEAAANASPFIQFDGVNDAGVAVTSLTAIPAIAVLMIVVSFAFKVAAVPFHAWTPDVYQGAPSSAVAFMATGVKVAAFAGLIRVVAVGFFEQAARISDTGWLNVLFWIAMLTMVLGNLVAIVQKDVKRMLAYSSIAHAGYITVGVAASCYADGMFYTMDAVVFYLLTYTFGTVGAFGVLAYLGKRGEECTTYDDLAGVATKHPGAALAMTIFVLSAAGIPPTAGFMAKFYVFRSAVETGEKMFIVLAVVGVLASVAGVYYYLKVILSMYMKAPRREVRALPSIEMKIALTVCAVFTLLLGVLPGSAIDTSRSGIERTLGVPPSVAAPLRERGRQRAATEAQKGATKPSRPQPSAAPGAGNPGTIEVVDSAGKRMPIEVRRTP